MKEYWKNRKDPSPKPVPEFVEDYFRKHLEGETLLDFGVGTGRMLHLYKGFEVVGYDIVDSYKEKCIKRAISLDLDFVHTLQFPIQPVDIIVCSKVLLHVDEPDIMKFYDTMKGLSKKIIVWDGICQTAPHTFQHNFGGMKDAHIFGNELLFTWS